jgi:peptide/nickel transport system permease protein
MPTRSRAEPHGAVPLITPLAIEAVRTAALLVLMALTTWGLRSAFQGTSGSGAWHARLWQTFRDVGYDETGRPIARVFLPAAGRSLSIVFVAAAWLGVGALGVGMASALWPSFSVVRLPLTLLSAIPAFLWPYLLDAFRWPLGPALFLAVGDLNAAALTGHCYEGLRRELSQAYVRTSRALGLSLWSDLWPRALVIVLDGLRARLPHLLGGTLAIELTYGIHGVGFLTFHTLTGPRPDYRLLVWVAALGIVAVRTLSLLHRAIAALLTHRPAAADESSPVTGLSLLAMLGRGTHRASAPHAFRSASPSVPAGAPPQCPGAATRLGRRLLALWRQAPVNRVKMVLAGLLAACGLALAVPVATGTRYTRDDTWGIHERPSREHLGGTNALGEDVLTTVVLGGRQLVLPLAVVLLAATWIGGVLGAVAGLTVGSPLEIALDLYAEMVESVPKLVLVLAAITFMSFEGYALKLYTVIGLAFAPLMYRAVREEVAVLRRGLFFEASLALGVPAGRVLWHHVLLRHCLPTLLREAAALVALVLLFDAILGFAGVRQYDEVFTWGNQLGAGLDEASKFEGTGLAFNPLVVWAPFTAMLIVIAVATALSDGMKSLGRSVRFGR